MKNKTPRWFVATLLLLIVPATAWRGYILSVLWAWFAVPQFEVAPLSIPSALGVAMLGSLFTGRWKYKAEDDDERSPSVRLAVSIAEGFGAPLFVLGWAAVVRLFL